MLENHSLKFNFQFNSGISDNGNLVVNVPFFVNIPFKSNLFLAQCIGDIPNLPSQLISGECRNICLSDEEKNLLHRISVDRQIEMAWVAHLIFNRGKLLPEIFKNSIFTAYKIYGQRSEALLRLIEMVCSISKNIFLPFKDKRVPDEDLPAWVWTTCETGFSLQRLRDTRLGSYLCIPELSNPKPLLSKVELFKKRKHYLDWLEGIETDIPNRNIGTPDENKDDPFSYFYFLVMEESKRIANLDDEFNATVWKNYLEIEKTCNNTDRKSKNRQNVIIKPDGTLFISGKNHKMPSLECKEI